MTMPRPRLQPGDHTLKALHTSCLRLHSALPGTSHPVSMVDRPRGTDVLPAHGVACSLCSVPCVLTVRGPLPWPRDLLLDQIRKCIPLGAPGPRQAGLDAPHPQYALILYSMISSIQSFLQCGDVLEDGLLLKKKTFFG